jgi:sialic acid synthase SpsE
MVKPPHETKHLVTLRPGIGISPMMYEDIIGRKLLINVFKNDLIKKTDF